MYSTCLLHSPSQHLENVDAVAVVAGLSAVCLARLLLISKERGMNTEKGGGGERRLCLLISELAYSMYSICLRRKHGLEVAYLCTYRYISMDTYSTNHHHRSRPAPRWVRPYLLLAFSFLFFSIWLLLSAQGWAGPATKSRTRNGCGGLLERIR